MADRTVFVEDVTVNEGVDSFAAFTLRRTGDLSQTDSVLIATSDGTATSGSDYLPGSGTAVFQPGLSSITFDLVLLDDGLAEGLEVFTIALSDPGGNAAGLTLQDGNISIYDDENSVPEFFEGQTFSTEFGTPITFSIEDVLQGATDPDGDTVNFEGFEFQDGGFDEISAEEITDNGDGTFTYTPPFFSLGGSLFFNTSDSRGGQGEGGVISFDVDQPAEPIYNLDFGGTVPEGDNGTASVTFTLTRIFPDGSGASDQLQDFVRVETETDLLVPPASGEALATSGVDFVPLDQVLAFGPGGNSFDIVVQINGDTEIELNELFDLDLSFTTGPNGEESIFGFRPDLLPQDAFATIANDDQADFALELGVPETGNFGNRFEEAMDTDGEIRATFEGTDEDLTLTFESFDVDLDTEVSVSLNGNLLGFLDAGVSDGLASYSFDISAADQVVGLNTISFNQEINDTFIWGVTDVLLDVVPPPTISVDDVTVNEDDGGVTLTFTRTGDVSQAENFNVNFVSGSATANEDFTPNAFGIFFFADEESFSFTVNGSLLDDSFAEGLETFDVVLSAAGNSTPGIVYDGGTVTIQDDENSDPDFFDGPTFDVGFGKSVTFTLDDLIGGVTDPDGDPVSFDGFFFASGEPIGETEITDNGDGTFTYAPGFFSPGGALLYNTSDNRGGIGEAIITLNVDTIPETPIYDLSFSRIAEGDSGTREMVFTLSRLFSDPNAGEANFVENIRVQTTLEPLFDLEDGEGLATPGVDYQPIDTVLTFGPDGNVINFSVPIFGDTDVEPDELFGLFLESADEFSSEGESFLGGQLPQDASGTIENDDTAGPPADINLTIGVTETGNFGNRFEQTTDTSGDIDANFTSNGTDLTLSFDAFDVDLDTEVSVFLNGNLLSFLDAGVGDALASYSFDIAAEDQVAGVNTITFNQEINDTFIWGVTDILLEEDVPPINENDLILGVENTGTFGNRFDGKSDEDGVIDFFFNGTGDDLMFSFKGFDIDLDTEVELFLNGSSQGFLDAGVNDGFADYDVVLAAADQNIGQNTLTFEQALNDTFIWGVTDLLITT